MFFTHRSRMVLFVLLAVLLLGAVSTVAAAHHEFDLTVRHNINGRALGLDKALPVDVCVGTDSTDDAYAFTFSFKDTLELTLPTGTYYFAVYLDDGAAGNACEGTPVMSLGPVTIPGGADVFVMATLGAHKTPTLRAVVR
jgi:hypothetical protein